MGKGVETELRTGGRLIEKERRKSPQKRKKMKNESKRSMEKDKIKRFFNILFLNQPREEDYRVRSYRKNNRGKKCRENVDSRLREY